MNEKIERILKIAAANGVSLNKNFTLGYLSTHGFYEGPQALAQNTVDEMERLCFVGMNNGFDGNLKTAIDKLSGVVISLTAVKNGDLRELSKLEVQRNKILDVANKVSYSAANDMREPVRDYIASSVDAIDTMLSLKGKGQFFEFTGKDQVAFMEESRKKLTELSIQMLNTMDVGSVKAKENAEKIIELIKGWRKDCNDKILSSGSLRLLDEAISVARQWNEITVAPTKKEKAKGVPEIVNDDLTSIARGRTVLEKLNVFNGLIQSKLKENDAKMAEINRDKDRVADLRAELAGLEKKKQDVAIQLKNDKDIAKANRAMADIRQQASKLEAEIRGLDGNKRLTIREQGVTSSRKIITNVKNIIDMLNDNEGSLAFLAKAVDKIDFNALVGFMSGRVSDLNAANESIINIKTRVETLRKNILTNSEVLEDNINVIDEVIYDGLDLEEEQIGLGEEELDPELAKLMESFKDEQGEEKVEENNTTIKRAVPLGDDDK